MTLASKEVSEERVFLMELAFRHVSFKSLESSEGIWKCQRFNASGMNVCKYEQRGLQLLFLLVKAAEFGSNLGTITRCSAKKRSYSPL